MKYLQSKHILVVEDDDLSFTYINQILKLNRCVVSRVKTGIDAIEFCKSDHKPDLVLLDIILPDMDGQKVAVEIRNTCMHLPIIAQTASQMSTEKDQLLQYGFNDLITKPFAINELIDVISRYLL